MKKYTKKRLISAMAAIAMGGLFLAGPLVGAEQKAPKALEQNQNVQASLTKEAGKKAEEKRQEIITEAVSALQETFNVLKALESGKKEEALKALANATGKLELVVTRDPDLAFAPVDVSMTTFDVVAAYQDVIMARKEVIRLLKEGNLPAARELLDSLRSEVVVSVAAIPLATYPDAIKAVTPLIDEGKVEEAKAALEAALSTLVVTCHVIPEEQLKLAEALGYGAHADYEALHDQIREIREKVSGGKSGTGFFDKLKASMLKLKAEIFGSTEEQPQKQQSKVAGEKEKKAPAK